MKRKILGLFLLVNVPIYADSVLDPILLTIQNSEYGAFKQLFFANKQNPGISKDDLVALHKQAKEVVEKRKQSASLFDDASDFRNLRDGAGLIAYSVAALAYWIIKQKPNYQWYSLFARTMPDRSFLQDAEPMLYTAKMDSIKVEAQKLRSKSVEEAQDVLKKNGYDDAYCTTMPLILDGKMLYSFALHLGCMAIGGYLIRQAWQRSEHHIHLLAAEDILFLLENELNSQMGIL